MRLGLVILFAATTLGLSACESVNSSRFPVYDGVPFRVTTKAESRRGDRALFQVHVDRAERSTQGALEAVHHASTRYCISNFGSSRFDWTNVQTDEDGRAVLPLVKGDAVIQGICKS